MGQLSLYTNADGSASTTKTPVFKFGPYLRSSAIPGEPVTSVADIEVVTTGALGLQATGTTGGWKFDNVTGQFIVNHSAWDDR